MSSFSYLLGRGVNAGIQSAVGGVLPGPLNMLDGADLSFQEVLNAQIQVQQETLAVNMQSNIIKAHHDARMAAIRNLRS